MNTFEEQCKTCERIARLDEVMRDWIWVKQGHHGDWFCSKACLSEKLRCVPTEEETKRMSQ